MSNPSPFLLSSDEQYDGTNWIEWKSTIWNAAKARGLTGYLNGSIIKPFPHSGTTPPPSTSYWGSTSPTVDEWMQRDAYTYGMIVLNVKNIIGHGVETEGTAAQAWTSLTSVKDAVSDIGLLHAERAIRAIRYTNGTDLSEHFSNLRKAWKIVNGQGGKIDDAAFRMIVLGSMPKEWNIIVSTLHSVKTSAEVIAQLTLHGMLLDRDRPVVTTPIQALATSQQGRTPRSTEVCTNPVCKRIGHPIERCFKPGGGMAGQYPDWWKKKGGGTNTGGAQTPTANIAVVSTSSPTVANGGEFYAFMTLVLNKSKGGNLTYADSAASKHCFVNRTDFVTYTPSKDHKGDTATQGGKFSILGTGNVKKRIIFEGKVINLTFEDAMHTPELSHNLISIGRLDKAGCFTVFGGGGATFINTKGAPFMYGRGEGTMYEVDLLPPTGDVSTKDLPTSIKATIAAAVRVSVFATHSHNKPTNIDTWHRRLGHVGYSTIEKMVNDTLVDGLDVTTMQKGPGMCEDCIMGKHARRPFDGGEQREKEVLERVYIDLWGPSRVQSTGGKSYMMQLVDGKSRHTEGYFLANKEAKTTLEALRHFHVTAERQMGKKLVYIRTDIGTKFCNDTWWDFCVEHGITHETTLGYSSASNGVVECSNRTVIERVRVLMHEAKLPPSLWCEVASTVIYLKNLLKGQYYGILLCS